MKVPAGKTKARTTSYLPGTGLNEGSEGYIDGYMGDKLVFVHNGRIYLLSANQCLHLKIID